MRTFQAAFLLLTNKYRLAFVLVILLSMLTAIFEMIGLASVAPFLQYLMTDSVPAQVDLVLNYFSIGVDNRVYVLGGVAAVLVLLSSLLTILNVYFLYFFAFKIGYYFSSKITDAVINSNPIYAAGIDTGELIRNVTQEANQRLVHNVGVASVLLISKSIVLIGLVFVCMLLYPVVSAAVFLVVGGIYLIIYKAMGSELKSLGKRLSDTNSRIIDLLSESTNNSREIYIWNKRSKWMSLYLKEQKEHNNAQHLYNFIANTPKPLIEMFVFVLVILVCMYMHYSGKMDSQFVGTSVALVAVGYKLLPNFQQIFTSVSSLLANKNAVDNVLSSLDAYKQQQMHTTVLRGGMENLKLEHICLEDCSVKYGDKLVLDDVSLSIDAGEKVAFIGESGSGKTTCLNLLLGLISPLKGALKVNGIDITSSGCKAEWSQACSLVSQNVCLLNLPLTENVSFWEDVINESKMTCVLEEAKVDFIHESGSIGVRGASLSGGQKQRVGLARALYKDHELLAMDEATSALDRNTEEYVLTNIVKNSEKTVVMIVHNLNLLSVFDKIVVFKGGKVEFQGTYSDLLIKSSEFNRLSVSYE